MGAEDYTVMHYEKKGKKTTKNAYNCEYTHDVSADFTLSITQSIRGIGRQKDNSLHNRCFVHILCLLNGRTFSHVLQGATSQNVSERKPPDSYL